MLLHTRRLVSRAKSRPDPSAMEAIVDDQATLYYSFSAAAESQPFTVGDDSPDRPLHRGRQITVTNGYRPRNLVSNRAR